MNRKILLSLTCALLLSLGLVVAVLLVDPSWGPSTRFAFSESPLRPSPSPVISMVVPAEVHLYNASSSPAGLPPDSAGVQPLPATAPAPARSASPVAPPLPVDHSPSPAAQVPEPPPPPPRRSPGPAADALPTPDSQDLEAISGFHSQRAHAVDLTHGPTAAQCPAAATPDCPALQACGAGIMVCGNSGMAEPSGPTTPPLNHPGKSQRVQAFSGAIFMLNNTFHNYGATVFSVTREPVRYLYGGCREDYTFVASPKLLRSSTKAFVRAATVAHCYATNIFHFFVEILPRYFQLLPVLRRYEDVHIIASTELWQWTVDLWFPEDRLSRRLFVMKPNGHQLHKTVFAKQMFVPTAFPCGEPVRHQFAIVRAHYFNNVQPRLLGPRLPSGPPDLILLYQRPPNGTRSLVEHEELHAALLQEYSSKVVRTFPGIYPSNFVAMLQLFARTKLLLGPHGAGLTGTVFLPPGATLLEIRPTRYPNTCYEFVAHACSMQYFVLKANGGKKDAMSVGVAKVVQTVRLVMQGPRDSPIAV